MAKSKYQRKPHVFRKKHDAAKWVKLYKEGVEVCFIAERFGGCVSTVAEYIKKEMAKCTK